jgi:chromatin remodeling complex protein RSC6
MSKTTKTATKTATKTTTKTATPIEATAKTTTPKTTATKTAATKTAATKTSTAKTTATKTVAPVVEAVVETVVEPVDETVVEPVSAIIGESTEFLAKLTQLGSQIAKIKTEYRALEKKMIREIKTAQKNSAKRKRKVGNRAPSGFVKPTLISDELANFLEKPSGTEMARTDVTREINKYIRAHDLQDKSNGRKINPDNKLSSLLKLKTTDELTYFNLQKYMSVHFQKSAAALAALAATISA